MKDVMQIEYTSIALIGAASNLSWILFPDRSAQSQEEMGSPLLKRCQNVKLNDAKETIVICWHIILCSSQSIETTKNQQMQ